MAKETDLPAHYEQLWESAPAIDPKLGRRRTAEFQSQPCLTTPRAVLAERPTNSALRLLSAPG